jgi:predicted permease
VRIERWISTLPLRWRSLVRRGRVERDLDDEIHDHLESQIEELVARGLEPAEAERIVRDRFGHVDLAKERCRETRHMDFVDALLQDLRYAARTLRRNRGFAATTILTLALGIGANTAVFSLVDGILLSRLPYPDPERLIGINATYPNGAFAALRDDIRSMDVAVYAEGHRFTMQSGGDPISVSGARVSAELFSILGVPPALGRWPRAGEDGSPRERVIVLSHALWSAEFRGDPAIVGRSVAIDGIAHEVIGVMPPGFTFPSSRTEVWVPLGLDPTNAPRYWAGDFMPAIGRLRPGATRAQALGELKLFQPRVVQLFPWRMPPTWNQDLAVVPLQEAVVGSVRSRLMILIASVGLILAIACANVANLSLSRAATREREIAVRTAIGASPARIARQLLTECLTLAAAGAVVGVVFGTQALAMLKRVLPADTPRLHEAQLNWRVLAFTAALSIAAGCVSGVAPVLHALRLRVRSSIEAGGRGGGRSVAVSLRVVLTVAQIACAVLLVITAGLLARSLWTLSTIDTGFRTGGVTVARISPTMAVCGAPERCVAFYRAFEERIRSTAGVQGAALVNTLPLTGAIAKRSFELEGFTPTSPNAAPLFWLNVVTPDYFSVLNIRIDSGRAFARRDLDGAPVAIVTATTAERFWPGENPVGQHVRFVGERAWREVVGVASDVRGYDLSRSVPEFIAGVVYVPHSLTGTMEDGRIPVDMTLVLRTPIDANSVAAMIRNAARESGGEIALGAITSMESLRSEAMAAPSATTSLLAAMALLAVGLGCIGVYGVLSFLVSRRTRDFGVRLALGAQPRDVFWLVIKEAAILCFGGIAIGIGGAMLVGRWLQSELHGVSPTDPVTYAGVAIAVAIVTLIASYAPTRRAMRVDPLIVIRED